MTIRNYTLSLDTACSITAAAVAVVAAVAKAARAAAAVAAKAPAAAVLLRRLPARIIVGSIRHLMDVSEALEAGAHVVTVPPAILRKMVWHPRTVETIAEFNEAWRKRSGPR